MEGFGQIRIGGYAWFRRVLGSVGNADTGGNTDAWKVVGKSNTEAAVHKVKGETPSASAVIVSPLKASAPLECPPWVCKSPTLKLARDGQVLSKSAARYKLGGNIGNGAFGVVYSAERNAFQVVIKFLGKADRKDALAECLSLERCRGSPHIAQLLDVVSTKKGVGLVLEPWGTDLDTLMKKPSVFNGGEVRSIIWDTCKGLQHLHGLGLVHADLKPANVLAQLINGTYSCKLSDLGSCQEVDVTM